MAKARTSPRQSKRRALLLLSLLLFPVTMNYMSPYVIIDGAMNGVVNGSLVVFGLLFISSLIVGRLWCGWLCPAAGLQEACTPIVGKPARGGWTNWIKWTIWVPWIALIVALAARAGGYRSVNLLHLTESGISIDASPDRPIYAAYAIYYIVLGLFMALPLIAGRRAACHTLCWMAPFMIVGWKLSNLLNWPALRLRARRDQCIQCQSCAQGCPMSLGVDAMVQAGAMENSECILCGSCVDTCPQEAIRYAFGRGE